MMNIGTIIPRPESWLPAGIAVLCILLAAPVQADIYKWTGDDGKTNYTQMPPPPGYTSERIRQAAPPPQASRESAKSSNGSLKLRREEVERDKQKDASKAKLNKENEEIRKLNCDAASRNLAALQEKNQRRYMTASGELLRPTDKEREKMIKDTRNQVEKHCDK